MSFNILNPVVETLGKEVSESDPSGEVVARIESMVKDNKIVMFIKGFPGHPMCGFSANTMAIFESLGQPYRTFNILEDMEIRQGIKTWANWPTFPQVYIDGELVGGNDIIVELYQSGELQQMVASE